MEAEDYKKVFLSYPEPVAKPLWVLDYDKMTTHTQGRLPERIISNARPNEDKAVTDYRVQNFRAVTMDAFVKAKTSLKRTLSHSAVEIIYPDKVKEFLNSNIFEKTNFLSYMQQYVVDKMIDAANGLLVWWPENVGDVAQQLTVKPILLIPEQILHFDNEVLTFLSEEKSEVVVDGNVSMSGDVYYIMLEDELWKRKETGNKGEETWIWEIYTVNPFGMIYALILGGESVIAYDYEAKRNIKYFTSYFRSAVEFGDECLCRHSDAQGTWISCASPIREVEPVDCLVCNKTGKVPRFNRFDKPLGMMPCTACNGQGYQIPTSSYGVIIRAKTEGKIGENPITTDRRAIEFLHPDTSILDFGEKSWQKYKEYTEQALDLIFTQEAQSGIAKEIDREDKLATLDKIAVHFYKYLIPTSINIIEGFLYPASEPEYIQINLPQSFTVKKSSDLQAEITQVKQNGAPAMLVGELRREEVFKTFSGDPVRMKMFDVNIMLDPLFTYTLGERNQMMASGSITERDWAFSIYAYPMISKYAKENPDFVNHDIDSIIAAITPMIEEKIVLKPEVNDGFTRI